jgi:thymidylate kinase
MAAWYYALEYGWRYLSTVALPRRQGRVVICDRYVYDLRESPWPGSRAAAFAERLVPRPDVLVLPDAPPEVIHARKPERSLADQAAQQAALKVLLAEHPARAANLIIDTSGPTPHPEADVVRAVYSAAHLGRHLQ